MSIFSRLFDALERLVHSHREMSLDEVNAALTKRAETATEKLDWKTSVVDLLKLLDLDSSFQARRALATELGFQGEFTGTEIQNAELHNLVMDDVAKRCTKIPTT